MNLQTVPFPSVFDDSTLSLAKSCWQKLFKSSFQHLKPKELSIHLHAGKSFAAGLEAARRSYYEGYYLDPTSSARILTPQCSHEDAVAIGVLVLMTTYGNFPCPYESAKSLERMSGALEYYFTNYPMTQDAAQPIILPDGTRGIEFSGVEPLEILHPETGDPILYCGRMDMLAKMSNDIFVYDDKTTGSLGASWAKNWDLRSQFTGYTWLAQRAGIKASGVLVRGIAILKTKYETQQSISYRPQWQVDRWYAETCDLIVEMIRNWKSNTWRHALGDSCADFGGCAFRDACMSQDESPWLEVKFTRRRWDPILREEIPL